MFSLTKWGSFRLKGEELVSESDLVKEFAVLTLEAARPDKHWKYNI